MSRSAERPRCPNCDRAMPRDLAAERKQVNASRAYLASSGGAMPHEMRRAFRDEHGNTMLPQKDGTLRQLNPPGFDLTPRGDVIVKNNRGERKRYLQTQRYTPND